ncbi:MAG TPA: class I SAM-dependent methyltransferase [Syntrophales bacterium]|nr:class I SAM-dependent methyltransferase [Syntrophales bacterium]
MKTDRAVGQQEAQTRRLRRRMVRSFNWRIKAGLVAVEPVACLCGSHDHRRIIGYDRHGLWAPVVICRICGMIFANPRMTAAAYEDFYSSDAYRTLYEGVDYMCEAKRRYREAENGNTAFAILDPIMAKRGLRTVMEFGCGGGWNLLPFLKRGYEVCGYDLSTTLTDLGRSEGLNLMTGSWERLEGQYDVIILNHVLEHFLDIFGAMDRLLGHLQPHGFMYVGVPNIDHADISQFQNAHVYYFSPRTFRYVLEKCRLTVAATGEDRGYHMYALAEKNKNPSTTVVQMPAGEFREMTRKLRFSRIKGFLNAWLVKTGLDSRLMSCYSRWSKGLSHGR